MPLAPLGSGPGFRVGLSGSERNSWYGWSIDEGSAWRENRWAGRAEIASEEMAGDWIGDSKTPWLRQLVPAAILAMGRWSMEGLNGAKIGGRGRGRMDIGVGALGRAGDNAQVCGPPPFCTQGRRA